MPDWGWTHGYEPFRRLGHDTFLTVAPGAIMLWTCAPDVVAQIVTRRNDFPKPAHLYVLVDIYGRNVVSAEGALWRRHRKITAAPFTEKNNAIVWDESLRQARAMLKSWVGDGADGDGLAADVASDTMSMTLNIISGAAFDKPLSWPGEPHPGPQDGPSHGRSAPSSVNEIAEGHLLSFHRALEILLQNMTVNLVVPRFLLRWSPLRKHRQISLSFDEWGRYMSEMYESKKKKILEGSTEEGFDLMEALVRGSGVSRETEDGSAPTNGKGKPSVGEPLTREEVMGNSFVFLLAGHETTANTVHFALLFLAVNPRSQRRLQEHISDVLGDRPTGQWDFERSMPRLLAGMAGAVMNETLRLIPPVTNITKMVSSTPQPINVDGRTAVLPPRALIRFVTPAAHRHPKYWPSPDDKLSSSGGSSGISTDEHLTQFRPERWLTRNATSTRGTAADAPASSGSSRDATPSLEADTADRHGAGLFHPVKGSYLPFSEGPRACLGRRFAQVEIMAVLATIFRDYSVELAVPDDDDDDDDVVARREKSSDEKAGAEEVTPNRADRQQQQSHQRRVRWEKARQNADYLMTEGMMSMITLKMVKGKVPLRIVKRGRERYRFD